MYGTKIWKMKKVHEKRLEVAEMRMLRWSYEITKVSRKIQESYIGKRVKRRN
jgi:hypothetical protein